LVPSAGGKALPRGIGKGGKAPPGGGAGPASGNGDGKPGALGQVRRRRGGAAENRFFVPPGKRGTHPGGSGRPGEGVVHPLSRNRRGAAAVGKSFLLYRPKPGLLGPAALFPPGPLGEGPGVLAGGAGTAAPPVPGKNPPGSGLGSCRRRSRGESGIRGLSGGRPVPGSPSPPPRGGRGWRSLSFGSPSPPAGGKPARSPSADPWATRACTAPAPWTENPFRIYTKRMLRFIGASGI